MIRIALAAGVLLAGFGAAAQESGGANVRFEQVPNSLTLRAKIYKNDGDRNIETGEILQQQSIVAKQGNGIPTAPPPVGISIVTVCALDFPTVTTCTGTGLPPSLPRFFVDKGNAIGIKSMPDGTTPNDKRINGLIPGATPAASAERMSITFNCTDALCGPRITSGRLILNAISHAPRTVFLYPTQNGTVVGSAPDRQSISVAPTLPGSQRPFRAARRRSTSARRRWRACPRSTGFRSARAAPMCCSPSDWPT